MKDITTTLFRVPSARIEPWCGAVLVADPFVREQYFNHGVVSIIDYVPTEGATGAVMNHLTEYELHDLLDGVDKNIRVPVYCGGPAGQDRIYFIHTLGTDIIPGAREYAPGLYIGGQFDAIIDYLNSGYQAEGNVRFFVGYSSWCENQLEGELRRRSWAIVPTEASPSEMLSQADDAYWHRAVRSLGDMYRSWQLIPRNVAAN